MEKLRFTLGGESENKTTKLVIQNRVNQTTPIVYQNDFEAFQNRLLEVDINRQVTQEFRLLVLGVEAVPGRIG